MAFPAVCLLGANRGYRELADVWIMWGVAQLENFRLKVFRTVAQQLSFRKAAEHVLHKNQGLYRRLA